MRHFLLYISLMISSASFAFESADSALDFVYEYASDTLWGIKLTDYTCMYHVGTMKHDVNTIINCRNVYENRDSVGLVSDTFVVPQEHYVFFITPPDNFIFEGNSPYVSYMFLSKKDSSYTVIDTIGDPECFMKWDTVREDGRLTKKQAIEDISHSIDYYTQANPQTYDVYLKRSTLSMAKKIVVSSIRYTSYVWGFACV